MEDHTGLRQLLWTLRQARSGGQLLPGGHGGKQDEALHSASWSCPLREAHEGTAQSSPPDQAWRHLSLGSPAQQECAESLAPHFQICSWGWRVLETKPRGSSRKSQPCPPFPGRVILLCLLKGSADRLELSWQRSLQSSHPQQTFATTSLPRGVSRAWQPLGHIQLTARLGSPGRLCGSLSDLPQGLCRPGAWAPYGSLLCCTALPPSPPHLHPPGPPRL